MNIKKEFTKRLGKIVILKGDIFSSEMQTITITVNTVGVMGKGIALKAKQMFPNVYKEYRQLCKESIIKIGKPYIYKTEQDLKYRKELVGENKMPVQLKFSSKNVPDNSKGVSDGSKDVSNTSKNVSLGSKWFLLFPTKEHWKQKSKVKYIVDGLEWLVNNYKKEGIESIALPALGCGLGGLDWSTVGPIMCKYLQQVDVPVEIYLPTDKKIPEDQLSKDFLFS